MLLSSEFHSDFAALRISIQEVGVNGLALIRAVGSEALTALLKEPHNELFSWQAPEAAVVKFSLSRENDHAFKVHTQADLRLSCTCVRCLDMVIHRIELNFEILMLERDELGDPDDDPTDCSFDSDAADGDADTAVGYYANRTIDLGLIVREQIFLSVPDYPHCGTETALVKSTCKPAAALLSEKVTARENPFVKFWKTN